MLRDSQTGLYHQEFFNELLAFEKKRCGRSEGLVLLMLADLSYFRDASERQQLAKSIMDALSEVIRDTDVKGWHVKGSVIGIMFAEMGSTPTSPYVQSHIENKCLRRLCSHLGPERFSRIQISWQLLNSGNILDIHKVV
jgi:hypothetical protein